MSDGTRPMKAVDEAFRLARESNATLREALGVTEPAAEIEWDQPGQNERRADWAEIALDAFREEVMPGEDIRTTMIDLISDLMHLAHRHRLDEHVILLHAWMSYKHDTTPGQPGSDAPVQQIDSV